MHILLIGIYLGIGLVVAVLYGFLAILGNSPKDILIALTCPISWPIVIWLEFLRRRNDT